MQNHRQKHTPWIAAFISITLLMFSGIAFAAANQLTDVKFLPLPDQKVQVNFSFQQPLKAMPKRFDTQNPARIVLDFYGVDNGLTRSHADVGLGGIDRYIVAQAEDRTRVILALQQKVPYDLKLNRNQLQMVVRSAQSHHKVARQEHFNAIANHSAHHQLKAIDFRREPGGGGQVVIQVSDANMAINVQQQADQILVDFMNVRIPKHLQRKYDVTDYNTPINAVRASQAGRNVHMVIQAQGKFQHMAYQVGKKFIVDVKPVSAKTARAAKLKQHYKGKRLSLNFQDIKVRAVLQLIAEFTGLNIVTSDSVKGSMTIRLNNVPWDQALDIILKTQGLAKRQVGNVILIAPSAELAAQEKQELENQQTVEELAPIHSELVRINYAKAADLAALLSQKGNKLLSERGNVSVDDRTNTLWVQDTADKLREIRALVRKLDVAVQQVLIEARIVIVNKDYERRLGIQFGVSKSGHLSGTLSGANALAGGTSPSGVDPFNDRLNVDLPAGNIGNFRAGSIGLALAKLGGGYLLDLELSALEQEKGGDVISSPRLITANQHPATIEQGEEIPYQQATSSGATAIAFKKAVLSLTVTPQITPDGNIILSLKVNQDSRGGEVLGVPIINTRQVETQVLVKNGETVVLGGIYERTKTNQVTRVPFLGSLPFIGPLFRHHQKIDNRRELLIFVTPKIVDQLPTTV